MNAQTASRTRSEINVTPLIDIVLVLLIVFIVMVPGLSKSLSVNIPVERPPQGEVSPQTPIVITLNQQGKLMLQKDEVSLDILVDRLVPVVQLQPMWNRKLFLKVDQDVLHQRIVQVLDKVRQASERAKEQTGARMENMDHNGGDVKVAITLLKRA
jgi:biopolymer transport protein TolR